MKGLTIPRALLVILAFMLLLVIAGVVMSWADLIR